MVYFGTYFLAATTAIILIYLLKLRKSKKIRKFPMVVLGSGGHTTQMLDLLQKFEFQKVNEIVFVLAETDNTSIAKTQNFLKQNKIITPVRWLAIPRSRQVKQSYITSVYTTFKAFLWSFWAIIVHHKHIDILIINGPGTCLPIAFIYTFLNCLSLTKCKIIFIQSWCRVKNLSMTGKLLRPIVDNFFVQWKPLSQRYPDTTLIKR